MTSGAVTRRGFLATLGTAAIAGFRSPIRLAIAGDAGRRGVELALDEMSRTALLVGRSVQAVDGTAADSSIVLVDLEGGRLRAGGEWYQVAADEDARAAALQAWRRAHETEAHDAIEWHPSLSRFGAEQLNDRFARRFGSRMDAVNWIGWMLIKIAVEAELRSVRVAEGRFDGHKGVPLRFDHRRRLVQPLCVVDAGGALLEMVGGQEGFGLFGGTGE